MKNHVVNHHNAVKMGLMNPIAEVNFGPSLTVPGQTLSLKQLLQRYVRGDSIATFQPMFSDDLDVPDYEYMDELDRLDMAHQLKNVVNDTRETLTARQKERAEKEKEKQAKPDSPSTPPLEIPSPPTPGK